MMIQSHDTQRIRPVPQVTYNTMDFKRMLCSGKQTTRHQTLQYCASTTLQAALSLDNPSGLAHWE